jgi:uncharacterized lipoprotein
MKSTIFKFMLLCTTTLLMACSSPTQQVIVSPELNIGSSNAYQLKQAQLLMRDLRTSPHIVQILRTGEATKLYSPQQALKANGLRFNTPAANQIEIIIDNALVSVKQAMLKYSASNLMNIRVVIHNSKGTLSKAFKVTGTSNGPLKADLAVLERDFNQQLTKLLSQIVQNEELQQFMQ